MTAAQRKELDAMREWARDVRQKTENMNAWAHGFGADVRASKSREDFRRIKIELDERRKAGLEQVKP